MSTSHVEKWTQKRNIEFDKLREVQTCIERERERESVRERERERGSGGGRETSSYLRKRRDTFMKKGRRSKRGRERGGESPYEKQ